MVNNRITQNWFYQEMPRNLKLPPVKVNHSPMKVKVENTLSDVKVSTDRLLQGWQKRRFFWGIFMEKKGLHIFMKSPLKIAIMQCILQTKM